MYKSNEIQIFCIVHCSLVLHLWHNVYYCHVIFLECDYRWGFGLIIGFIGLFDIAHEYTLHFNIIHTHTRARARTHTHTNIYSNSRHSPSSEFLNCPWFQLLASHSNSSQRLKPLHSCN
jgi:hypothetical protein